MNDNPSDKTPPTSRREFFKKFVTTAGRTTLAGGALGSILSLRQGREAPPGARDQLGTIRPPGAHEEPNFLAKCIRCTRCADACEAQCILFFGPEAGNLQGTPYIFPNAKGCTMCLQCGTACPTNALVPQQKKEDIKMGVAVVDERLCVSHNGTGVCGACHTICPLRNRAITQNFRNAPVVHADICTGCGLCEEVCIVRDRRAIQVKTDRLYASAATEEIPQ